MSDVLLAFMAGFAGSFHCIGMCGGIAAAVAMAGGQCPISSRLQHQLLYNLGRITTYSALGGTAGFIGGSLSLLGLREFSFWFMLSAYLFVIAVGLFSLLQADRFGFFIIESTVGRFLAAPVKRLLHGDGPLRFYPLGIILGFLPCGLLYALLVTAVASGDAVKGGLIMAALGFGTMPAMMMVGAAATLFSARVKGIFFRLAGLFVALMGVSGLWRVLAGMGYLDPPPW